VDWDTLKSRVTKLTDDFEPAGPKQYDKLRPGR
jgi:hypothetical protein